MREAHRSRELLDQQRGHPLRRFDARSHGRHERRVRFDEFRLVERGSEPICRPGHQRAVERAGHAQLHGTARAGLFGGRTGLVDRGILSGDDDLAGAVVVRGPHVEDAPANAFDDLVVEAEDRGHRARILASGLRHCQPAFTYERNGLFDLERPSSS